MVLILHTRLVLSSGLSIQTPYTNRVIEELSSRCVAVLLNSMEWIIRVFIFESSTLMYIIKRLYSSLEIPFKIKDIINAHVWDRAPSEPGKQSRGARKGDDCKGKRPLESTESTRDVQRCTRILQSPLRAARRGGDYIDVLRSAESS